MVCVGIHIETHSQKKRKTRLFQTYGSITGDSIVSELGTGGTVDMWRAEWIRRSCEIVASDVGNAGDGS
jgi:hypothetical protein